MAELFSPLEARPLKDTICLFDVDGTLSPARLHASPEMLQTLAALRHKCAIGFVGGSNLPKQEEQLSTPNVPVTSLFDFCFSENGLTAYRLGKPLASQSFIGWIGEEKYQKLVRFLLRYIAGIEGLPAMRGTFVEFRNGMVNVSPVGRNASKEERDEFEKWDKESKCREKMIAAIKEEFPDSGLTYVCEDSCSGWIVADMCAE
jgi:phosphomannomutase